MESLEVRREPQPRTSVVKRIWRASIAGYFSEASTRGTSFGEPSKEVQEVPPGITRQEAWSNMVLALIGVMVCLLPNIMAQCGYLLSPPLLLLSALVVIRMGGLICEACALVEETTGSSPGSLKSYEDLARAVSMYKVVLVTKNTVMMACLLIAQSFLTGALSGLIPWKVSKPTLRWAVIMPLFCGMVLLKDLNQLSKLAWLGLLGR